MFSKVRIKLYCNKLLLQFKYVSVDGRLSNDIILF